MKASRPSDQTARQPKSPDAAAMEAMQPGPEHERLARMVGTWKAEYTRWMQEGVEPVKATGRSVFSKVFDGRFIREEFTSDFQGKAFMGIGTMGYDRAARSFVHAWYDNMGTGITCTRGTVDGREMVLEGSMICPMRGEMHLRHVYAHTSDDAFTLTMFAGQDGKEAKGMEIVYTRQR